MRTRRALDGRLALKQPDRGVAADALLARVEEGLQVAHQGVEEPGLVQHRAVQVAEGGLPKSCCRESTSFSSSRWAAISATAAGASNATRPLMPRIVSPTCIPRPTPWRRRRRQALDKRDRLQRRTSSRTGTPRSKSIRTRCGSAGPPPGRRRQQVGVLRQHALAAVRLLTADRGPPEPAIDRILARFRRHGDAALGQPGSLGVAGDPLLADGRQDRRGGRQDAERRIEADLVVARPGRAVHQGVGRHRRAYWATRLAWATRSAETQSG